MAGYLAIASSANAPPPPPLKHLHVINWTQNASVHRTDAFGRTPMRNHSSAR